ncbi:SF1B family DNA helicase RecD2 [Dictyobacter arantiisoli]|uniref:ATP-dependent RecD2 DNA helicase n=1 Tax=Dictyobacter arantiisoli TaxID=2014874 RepID=A0A5A5TEB8_9CHLR|nr:ATP-dependent RecD-like DNA helicase [Dictyobacter arantiisoli]GCF09588.1 ATP-dependent RecD-like DNA helicase [Dictyobacter arantiisoli]
MPKLEGSVENIVFHNEENQYTVARFRLNDRGRLFRDDLTTIVGVLPGVHPGELLSVEGEWESDSRYGRQLRVESFVQRLPASTDGMIRYLGSGLIKGIGPKKAQAIVDHFGEQTLAIIEQQPEMLRQVKGISSKDSERIEKAWLEQSDIKELHLFLQSHDVSVNVATRVYKQYGRESIRVVRENPYQLAQEVQGIGFRTADDIAVKLGLPHDSIPRLASGLKYVLTRAANDDGHCFLLEDDLLQRASHILQVPQETLQAAMEQLHSEQDVFIEPVPSSISAAQIGPADLTPAVEVHDQGMGDTPASRQQLRIYYGPFWYAENGSMRLLRILQRSPSSLPPTSQKQWEIVFNRLKELRHMELTDRQREAVQVAYQQKVSILTGGPGTGKSTSLRALLMLLRTRKVDFALAAPTGRAAKRMTEATGVQAKTLHRLLEYAPHDNSYQRNEDNPLPYQFVIVDEFSMVDILLFYNLLKALPHTAHILLVGDADQLPSVGPGNVLRDLLRSEALPAVRLMDLFRQARQSQIIVTAHQINSGIVPGLKSAASSDFFFMREDDPYRAQQLIVDLVQKRLPARYHFNAISDIQVLAPMYKGAVGVELLNQCLQAQLNPNAVARVEWADRLFCIGDKVMQTKNNYDKGVFNGDVGFIRRIDKENLIVNVEFAEEAGPLLVEYAFHELDELVLAYAVTVHKSQGSEYPAVVLPLVREHHMLLQRNLLYTAITRAKRFCVLVGQPAALEYAIQNDRVAWRNTGLAERLIQIGHATVQLPG